VAVFVNVPGINGGATEQNHKQWIPVDSMTFGVNRNISMTTGATTGREAALPNLSEVHISKDMDLSSIELYGWAVSQYTAKCVKLDIVTTGRADPFTQYQLENCVISGYSVSAGASMPVETISFSFTKCTVKFTPIDETMQPGSPVTKGFDVSTGQAF
jgi:type VI secretion system secreted protein Hcp